MDNMLLETIENKKIIIYGTGHIAQKFYLALKKNGADKLVEKCVVSVWEGKDHWIDNIPIEIFGIKKIEDDEIVCVAVHYAIKDDIVDNLLKAGCKNYVWIYPYLHEMLLGKPVARKKKIPLECVNGTCKEDYRMAARILAIENYFGKNEYGYDLYIRLQSLHCNNETAKKRLQAFIELIKSWEKNGYQENSVVIINQNFEIVDGAHRVALANYYDCENIYCDVYETDMTAIDVHGKEVMITREVLVNSDFSDEELLVLEEKRKQLFSEL